MKCCRFVSGRFSLSLILHSSIAFCCAGFGEARAALRNACVLPAAPPSCIPFRADEQASTSVRRLVRLQPIRALCCCLPLLIYIYFRVSLSWCPVISFVLKGCVPALRYPYVRLCLSLYLLSPSIICFSVQDPGGPASFLHASV